MESCGSSNCGGLLKNYFPLPDFLEGFFAYLSHRDNLSKYTNVFLKGLFTLLRGKTPIELRHNENCAAVIGRQRKGIAGSSGRMQC